MKGDFSRQTANLKKHYSGVLMQQGRVQLDADWNEQLAIGQHRIQTEARDVIGPAAAPLSGGGLAIAFTEGFAVLTISPGRMYVDGILCELEATSIPISNLHYKALSVEVPVWSVDGRDFQPGQWVEFSDIVGGKSITMLAQINVVDPANLLLGFVDVDFNNFTATTRLRRIPSYTTQPDYPILQPDSPGPDYSYTTGSGSTNLTVLDLSKLPQNTVPLIYLDVWQRHVTWLDDPHIREVALNGADTTTRVQVVQQVKILPVQTSQGTTCSTHFSEWDTLVAPSTGTLNAWTTAPTTTTSVCLPPPGTGYQRLDNQLYRLEIDQGGDSARQDHITFKASRDNGSVLVAIDSFKGNDITVKEVGLDDVLGFANADGQTIWGEIVSDVTELHGLPGQLVQIKHVEPLTRTITVDPGSTPLTPVDKLQYKLRRWDLFGTVTFGPQDLEGGIQLQFSPGAYKTGNYWLIPARTTTGQIEWPQDSSGRSIPQPPLGITHHYCRLALLEPLPGGVPLWSVQDCRRSFPSLTAPLAMHVQNTNWTNDDFFTSDQLIDEGLHITLDTMINAPLLNPAAISVSLELPLEFIVSGSFDMNINGTAKAPQNVITWTWDNMDKGTLSQALLDIINTFQALKIQRAPYMRVTLKGHATSSQQGDQLVYLDGQAFGQPGVRSDLTQTARTALAFPTGAAVAASDFESWFPLVPSPLRITSIEFLSQTEPQYGPIALPPAPGQPITVPAQTDQQGNQVFMNRLQITFNRAVVPGNLPSQVTITYNFPFFLFGEVAGPRAEAAVFPQRPVVPSPFSGGGSDVVAGTVTVDPTQKIVTFTVTKLPIFDSTVFLPGNYSLTVNGTTNPVLAADNGIALDGDYNFLPSGDFTLDFDVAF